MAITREKKEELVEQYRELIEGSSAIVFTDYRGASVPQLQSLRVKMQETGTSYLVVKNSLFGIALDQAGRRRPEELLDGPNAVALVGEDIGKGVGALKDWIRDAKIVSIRGALLEQSVLDAQGAEALSDLPTREEMLATTLGTILAPLSNLARVLNAPNASLARVLNAYVEKQKEAEAA